MTTLQRLSLLILISCIGVSAPCSDVPVTISNAMSVDYQTAESGENRLGVRIDPLSLFRWTRPQTKVYVERAVPLWRPSPGQQLAAAGEEAVADVNAAVERVETTRAQSWREIIAAHFSRNAGKYVAALGLVAIGAVGYALYEDHNDNSHADIHPQPHIDNRFDQSPVVYVTTGNESPVTVSVHVNNK